MNQDQSQGPLEREMPDEISPISEVQRDVTEPSIPSDKSSRPAASDEAAAKILTQGTERVSKLMARAGLASRRAAEDIIAQGRVSINGHFVREPGAKADPTRDRIIVDGKPLVLGEKTTTVVLLHKPKYVVTTRDDQGKRTTVMDLLPNKFQKFHPVGRLDYETTGVLLLSDDGDLTNLLTHPSHGVEKVYEARVRGEVGREAIEKLERGVYLEDGKTAPCRARVLAQREKNALVELTLREGRTRQARRMLEAVGHPVSSLRRVRFAGVELEGLESGAFRVLLPGEVKQVRKAAEAGLKGVKPRPKAARKASSKPKSTATRSAEGKGPFAKSASSVFSPGTAPSQKTQPSKSVNSASSSPSKRPRAARDDQSALAKRIEKKWR